MRASDLRALRDKYERMLGLRLLHDRAREEPEFIEPNPRAAMAELARAFPGALREIDELAVEVIRQRIDALAAAERGTSIEPWMRAHASFHRLARGALAAKRWLRGRPLTPELEADFARAVSAMPNAEEVAPWAADLGAIAIPPRGRIMDLVYDRLARELGIDVTAARLAIMPSRRLLRRS